MKALIFDCDGVLVDTERDGHRVAFNRAFAAMGLGVEWDIPTYGRLLRIAGGKERMTAYFDSREWPAGVSDRAAFIQELHRRKTDLFMQIVEGGELPLRSGVARVIDEAISDGVALAVCSTSNERAVSLIVEHMLGPERRARFSAILAGDIVPKKKPAPAIYDLAKKRLALPGSECLVVEDSRNGLLSAIAAGCHCVVTTSVYTSAEDFAGAEAVYSELGDPPGAHVTLAELRRMAER
jgi:HAD superfamily hydrolase (TIGR01509 family)